MIEFSRDTCEFLTTGKPLLMTREELSGLLKIDRRTTHRLVKEGHLPQPIQIGGSIRWRCADIDKLISAEP